jgi:hypothetical protein
MLGLLHQHATVAAKSVPDICDPTRLEEWSTRGAMTSSSTRASIIWGIIGPLRMFGQDELLLPFLKCIGLYAHRMNMEVGAHGPEGKKNCVAAAPALLSLTTFLVIAFFPTLTKRLFRSWWEANVVVRWRQEELFIPLIHAIVTRSNDGESGFGSH